MEEKESNLKKNSQVKREIGVVTATSIVVANMIGAGIFTTSGLMAAQLPGPGWVLFCWLLGGLIALAGALCYAELATRMPEEGGEYTYLKKLYHPALGFLTGWTSFIVGFSAPIAGSALGFSEYIFAGLDIQSPVMGTVPVVFFKKSMAIAIILIFTTVHYMGLRLGSRIQNVLTFLKILIVMGLASVGLILGGTQGTSLTFQIGGSSTGVAFGTAMMFVMFSYSGWNASAYIAGEVKRPRKTLPLSLVGGTLIVIILYIAINLFIFHAVPYSVLQGTVTVVEEASVRAFGDWMGNLMGLLIGLALLSSMSAFILIGPRVYYAMARDRLFFSFASRVHPKTRVPGRSILIQGTLAVVMVIVGSIEQLFVYLGFALNIFPWLAIAGLVIARRKHVGDDSAVKVWGYPLVPVFYLVSSLILMIFNTVNRPQESTAAILTVVLGFICYLFWAKGREDSRNRS